MRKVTFGCANSLDNFIAREDGSHDWLLHGEEANEIMREFWPKIDTMVMGRKTYDIAQQYAPKPKKTGKKTKPKTHIGQLKTYVFSRTLEPGERDDVVFLDSDPGEFVRELKQQEGKEICIMAGGDLGTALLDAGVIDEIGFNIHPVLLGSGVPLFHKMSRQIDLELIECRQFKNGCVYVKYRVKN
jgi:dihydrofolate reductase